MAENSKIEWTDHTFNTWTGCAKVSPACAHCYAESYAKRTGGAEWGNKGTRIKTSEPYWKQPLKWNSNANGHRPRVFCSSLADVFEEWTGLLLHHKRDPNGRRYQLLKCDSCGAYHRDDQASDSESCECSRFKQRMEWATLDDLRRDLISLICQTNNLDWLLLTKRPENALPMLVRCGLYAVENPDLPCPQPNLWIGTTVENQEYADQRIPHLVRTPAVVRFLSAEPLLGPIDLRRAWKCPHCGGHDAGGVELHCSGCGRPGRFADWVIVGGESGHGARPMHPDWARSIRDQCQAAGVSFFFKQWGEWVDLRQSQHCDSLRDRGHNPGFCHIDKHGQPTQTVAPNRDAGDVSVYRFGKKETGRTLDGREWSEFPVARLLT